MSYLARIHDLTTGRFLMRCSVDAHDLHEAGQAAIIKAALAMKGQPHEVDVRHLHQCAVPKPPAPDVGHRISHPCVA